MFCDQCGQRIEARDRFCQSCGAPVRPQRGLVRRGPLNVRWAVAGILALLAIWGITKWSSRPPGQPTGQPPAESGITEQDRAAWFSLLEQSTSPQTRPTLRHATIAGLTSGQVTEKTSVRLRGRIVAAEHGPNGSLVRVADGSGTLLIAYPGTGDATSPGARVVVVGQYLGHGMFADSVHPEGLVHSLTQAWTGLIFGMTASWLLALLLLVSAIRLSLRRRRFAMGTH